MGLAALWDDDRGHPGDNIAHRTLHQGTAPATKFSAFALRSSAILLLAGSAANAQTPRKSDPAVYQNPILYSDYSDPDVIRDGRDYYLVASSFHFSPGLPILHSRDLVHWEIAGHVLPRLDFGPKYDMDGGDRYGRGVWAPAVRFHNGLFYMYFPTPDEGIFVSTAPKMTGPWSAPVAVIAEPKLEDPCPFWDDDGTAYLVHSRTGAGPLILHRMAPDGKSVLDAGKVIVQDPEHLHTLEGPKIYKRNGWYYIFAPFGGVSTGAQTVLRSRNIYGPYENRTVLAQGSTPVNGPHQGAYLETPEGKGWFVHFSSRGAHGRIDYLEPVRWQDDWPVMGEAAPGAITGQPVAHAPVPVVVPGVQNVRPQTSDEFSESALPPMWEWNHNPDNTRWSLSERKGFLRLHAGYAEDLYHARNTLTEQMQDESLEFTVRLDVQHMADGDRAGLSMLEKGLSYVGVVQTGGQRSIIFSSAGKDATGAALSGSTVILRAQVSDDVAIYSYSLDSGKTFQTIGEPMHLVFSWWKGARPALFSFSTDREHAGKGFVDIDWAHYKPTETTQQASR